MSSIARFDPTVKPAWGASLNPDYKLANLFRGAWLFNEHSGAPANLANPAGNALAGFTGGLNWVGGRNGAALNFNGTTGALSVPDSGGISFGGPVTLISSFKTSSSAAQILYGGYLGSGAFTGIGLGTSIITGGKLSWWSSAQASWAETSVAVTDGAWHQAGISASGTTVKAYIDGLSAGSLTSHDSVAWAGTKGIGVAAGGATNFFNGQINWIYLLAGALTPDNFAELYAEPFAPFRPTQRIDYFLLSSGTSFNVSFTESAGSTDLYTVTGAFASSLAESATATDSETVSAALVASVAESATATDSETVSAALVASVSEGATASDASALSAALVATLTESATGSDDVSSMTASFTVALAESATATDSEAVQNGTFQTLTETATASDAYTATAAFTAGVVESATASEGYDVAAAFSLTFSESTTASDSNTGTPANAPTLSESATAGDSAGVSAALVASLTESATATDSFVVLPSFALGLSESANAGDGYTATDAPAGSQPTPTTLEAAIKLFLPGQTALTAAFGSAFYAGRKPAGTAAPYFILDIQGSPTTLFTSTSTVQATRVGMSAYATTRDQAETLQNLIFATFKGQSFPYVGVKVAPLYVVNRTVTPCPNLGPNGSLLYCAKVEWIAREQKPR